MKLKNVAIANALQLEADDAASVVLNFNWEACAKFEVGQPVRCCLIAFWLLIRYVMVWPWTLTSWPWTLKIHQMSRVQSLYEVWAKSNNPLLSYW